MPALHLLAMWALITYFVVFREPLAAAGRGMGVASGWSVQLAPFFFWGFVTLELLFSGLVSALPPLLPALPRLTPYFFSPDTLQPPTLLALALPHLPPPIPPSS
ncbi:hypothetical protein C8J57DRAFT_1528954 [Mycena rebaudengoi]|nr:hypothetical protein C8J57DRAFT_1528954 [Mycena rebaudengoi]